MADVYLDLTQEVPIPDDNDPDVLAAIERALKDVDEGRVYTREEVEQHIKKWRTTPHSPGPIFP